MPRDAQGLLLSGSASSAESLDRAVLDYYAWSGDPLAVLNEAVERDPAFTLGHSAIASLLVLNGVRGDNPAVVSALQSAERAIGGATEREKRHLAAARRWADGHIIDAASLWEEILLDHPNDALALRFAHDTYFYLGHSLSIRDSVARVLPAWDEQNGLYGYVLGQYAFGLEEAGELKKAEQVGLNAIARNAEDGWAVHAVAHVLETESRQQEGISFLKASRPSWSKANALSVHNGWHLALYLIEEGRLDEVLVDYDRHVSPKLAADSLLDLVDAAALLWRIELAGGTVGDRWKAVADQWLTHVDDHVLVFNDLHLALAVSRAGDRQALARFTAALDCYQRDGKGDNHEITVDVGRRLIDGILAFAEGNYARAVDQILPVRYKIIRIGGSHAQRDLLTQTLIAAAERSGQTSLAKRHLPRKGNRCIFAVLYLCYVVYLLYF